MPSFLLSFDYFCIFSFFHSDLSLFYFFYTSCTGIGGTGNNVAGTLPFEISLLSGLKSMIIRQNALGGSIPDSWTTLTTLELVSLGLNELTGTLPESLINNNPNLRSIFLEDNKLSGGLPLSPVSNALTQLRLNGNDLEGPIPSGFSGLSVLRKFLFCPFEKALSTSGNDFF